ncbi:MAG: penicillin-binding protein activator [Deltaproteobacteria bacterium]|nr:penicillin-binding protein activator [Deltaproteobacteria bacterium]
MQITNHKTLTAVLAVIAVLLIFSLPSYGVDAEAVLPLLRVLPSSPDVMALFEALEAAPNGKNELKSLEIYVDKNPDGPGVPEALLRLGRAYNGGNTPTAKKDYEKAAAFFKRLIVNFPSSTFKTEAMLELGAVLKKTGRIIEARELLEAVAGAAEAPFTFRARARILLKETLDNAIVSVEKGPPAIGVLLPRKGNYKKYGDDALSGIMLAADAFGNGQVELLVRDVGAESASAKGAVEELSANPRVGGILGPLLNASAGEAAKTAQEHRLPIIALAQKEGLTQAGEYVFRNFLTPSAQVQAIVGYAVKTLGIKNFAVLYPSNGYGTELAKLFEKEAFVQGASISAEMSYTPGITDFSVQMSTLFNVQVKESKAGRRAIKEYEPKLKAEAVFIPDTYEAASLIAPWFEYYNIKDVRMLGANAWNSARFAELGGKNVEGAVFVDAFYSKNRGETAETFVNKFKEAFGGEPSALEAQAFDSAKILIAAVTEAHKSLKIDAPPGETRDDVAARLRNVRDFKGATGVVSFNAGREAQKKPFILTVKNGEIVDASSP